MLFQAIEHYSPHAGGGREKRPQIPALFGAIGSSDADKGSTTSLEVQDAGENLQQTSSEHVTSSSRHMAGFYQDVTASVSEPNPNQEDRSSEENSRSIWFGKLRQETADNQTRAVSGSPLSAAAETDTCRSSSPKRQDVSSQSVDYLSTLPARQRQLFRRIQQQQREPVACQEGSSPASETHHADEKWYSSDEEEAKSISDFIKTVRQKPELQSSNADTSCNPILPKLDLNSLENINVAEIAKALSSLQQNQTAMVSGDDATDIARRDPRTRDPRTSRAGSSSAAGMGDIDLRIQGGINRAAVQQDVDLRLAAPGTTNDVDFRLSAGSFEKVGSADIDLRRFGLPFQPSSASLLPPVREIDASFDSHPPMEYRVCIVDCIPLDYSLIRVNSDWAHLDPRQQKSFSSDSVVHQQRDFSSTEPPSIPLGPASPDPPSPPELHGMRTDMDTSSGYSSFRPCSSDPRARDPRRSASVAQHQSQPQMPEKRGLLGVAPPGLLPFLAKNSSTGLQDASNDNYGLASSSTPPFGDRAYGESPRELQNRQADNRRDPRDPRQRLRNTPTAVDPPSRSYTPPHDRNFR